VAKKLCINDVVRQSGLSRATVDRVLNRRAGVRPETIAKVDAVLDALGFAPTALATRALDQNRHVDIVLPEGANPFFEELRKGFDAAARAAARHGCTTTFHTCDPYRPDTVVQALQRVSHKSEAVIVVGVDTQEVTCAIHGMIDVGSRVVTAVSDVSASARSAYVGQDNFLAGRTAGRLLTAMLPKPEGSVVILLGHLQFRHLLDRKSGFRQIVGMLRPGLIMHTSPAYGTDPQTARDIVEQEIARHADLVGVYLAGGGQPAIIAALSGLTSRGIVTIAHEVSHVSRAALQNGTLSALVGHNVYEVGQKALDAALGNDVGDGTCGINVYLQDNLPRI